jgi:hypothetical protein
MSKDLDDNMLTPYPEDDDESCTFSGVTNTLNQIFYLLSSYK